ncbi:MAG TPA: GntR family transcriptional regulator [Ktedonobacterales bacterium]|nr:GntR family transcriptional regulator [Ktedonobacterales bacterium]
MPIPSSAAPVSRKCLSDDAYAQLRDWIIDGTLAPGEALRDEALSEALGMSRTPIRDALQRLENEGLVVTSANRRTSVSPVTLKQARDIYPITAELETFALRLAMSTIDEAALDAMRAANGVLAAALAVGDAGTATQADFEVHGGFIACCANDELRTILAELKAKVCRLERAFWGWADRTPSVRDHDELIAALAARDLAKAERVLARNWDRGLAWITPQAAQSR